MELKMHLIIRFIDKLDDQSFAELLHADIAFDTMKDSKSIRSEILRGLTTSRFRHSLNLD